MRKRVRSEESDFAQESLQMGVSITEVKDHMEYWLNKRVSEIKTTHERISTLKVVPSMSFSTSRCSPERKDPR